MNFNISTGGYDSIAHNRILSYAYDGNAGIIPAMNGIYLMRDDKTMQTKPVIVVSNAEYNKGPFCYICPLTVDDKPASPTIFKTWATGRESNAIIDNLRSIDKTRLVEYIGELSSVEIQAKNDAICNLFGINTLELPAELQDIGSSSSNTDNQDKYIEDLKHQLKQEREHANDLRKEVEFYKQQYDALLNKVISAKTV